MTTADRMARRLATTPPAEHGATCTACGTTALACQYTYVTSDEQHRCCATCHEIGGRYAHTGVTS